MKGGSLPGTLDQIRYNLTKLTSLHLKDDAKSCKNALDEIKMFKPYIYLKSLYLQPEIRSLQDELVKKLDGGVVSNVCLIAESAIEVLGRDGTGTGRHDIAIKSRDLPYSEFGPCGVPDSMPVLSKTINIFSDTDLLCLFALYLKSTKVFYEKIINFESDLILDGDILEFSKRALESTNNSAFVSEIGEFISSRGSNLEYLRELCHRLANLPLGEYKYDIPALGSLDKYIKPQHSCVLVRNDGLCVELVGIKLASGACVRPTSFITFMERAIKRSRVYRNGIDYQSYKNEFSDGVILQRGIQTIGGWNYNLIIQNCQTVSRWICLDAFLCKI